MKLPVLNKSQKGIIYYCDLCSVTPQTSDWVLHQDENKSTKALLTKLHFLIITTLKLKKKTLYKWRHIL